MPSAFVPTRPRNGRPSRPAEGRPAAIGDRRPGRPGARPLGLILLALLLGGCATAPSHSGAEGDSAGPDFACLSWYRNLDAALTDQGLRDAGAAPVAGHPHLRVNRYLASFAEQAADGPLWSWWIGRMAALDRQARQLELSQLPQAQSQRLEAERLGDCVRRLTAQTLALTAPQRGALARTIQVPDHYISWQQLLGLYPIPALIARSQIDDLHDQLAAPFGKDWRELDYQGEAVSYHPRIGADPDPDSSLALYAALPDDDVLRRYETATVNELLRRHAPVLRVDTRNDNDRIGRVRLDRNGRPEVDVSQPQAYQYLTATRHGSRSWLQLNYLFWFPARDTDDIYGGHMDALLWRVTLDSDLRVAAYDSIHGCGCYYMLFPGPGYRALGTPPSSEPVLSPRPAPALDADQRLRLHLSAATHYLRQIDVVGTGDPIGVGYDLLAYDRLRALPAGPDRPRRSLFDRHGLVPSSQRTERYLLWPLGVRSAGAMRQAGTHAIAFIGRRHFDDARLLERLIGAATP